VLRDHLNLVGTKFGCGGNFCGACTVHVDRAAVRSCSLPIGEVGARPVVTIEGLTATLSPGSRLPASGSLHPVQAAWEEIDVPQCGYCQAGQIMTAAALLARNNHPTDEEIVAAMNGNLCRCGTYLRIRAAVRRAAVLMSSGTKAG
jgi:isoquinoline 1-oxidoreductase alpha subunit